MLTDRQRHNWFAALTALRACERLNSGNTASVCDGTPFLTPDEKQTVEVHIAWLRKLVAEVESGQRSAPTDGITLHTAAGEATYRGPSPQLPPT